LAEVAMWVAVVAEGVRSLLSCFFVGHGRDM